MKIIRVFPRRTSYTPKDDMVFIGDPSLDRPEADEVHISCTFTWDLPEVRRLYLAWSQYYAEVYCGGPAWNEQADGFTPGRYLRDGVTITSRGCNNQCPWCLVPKREGKIREIPIAVGNIEQSNNLLQCSQRHIDSVFDMLSHQKHVMISGGLEASMVTQYIADRLRSLHICQVFLACDTPKAIHPLRKALKLLKLSREKVRCYVLLKFNPNETVSDATERMIQVFEAGALPFAQLYQPADHYIKYPGEWRQFARTWSRPAAMKSFMKGNQI